MLFQAPIPTAILVDNMYLLNAAKVFGVEQTDPRKYPEVFLRDQPPEEHYRTFIFDALPFVPERGANRWQIEQYRRKLAYLKAIEYYERIAVELGEVRPKHTHCFRCGANFNVAVQKLVDVKISVRLVSLAWSGVVRKIVLVSGDSDLLPAVEAVKDSPTTVRLAYVEEQDVQTSQALIRACPEKQKLTIQDITACKHAFANHFMDKAPALFNYRSQDNQT
ncbi:MAG: NYN domain-containing protein [Candidatus Bathyarchaeia archaeon]